MDVAKRPLTLAVARNGVAALMVLMMAPRVAPGLLLPACFAGSGLLGVGIALYVPAKRVLGLPLDGLLAGVVLAMLFVAPLLVAPPRTRCGMVPPPGALSAAVGGGGDVAHFSCDNGGER
jgi:hypothetical protein